MRPLLALFVRALRQSTRASSTYFIRGGVALMVLLLLWSAHERLSWAGAVGLRFFSSLLAVNYLVVTLVGLGLFSSAIAEEKEEGTLGLMRMADLSPLAILFGKSTSQLGVLLLLLLTQVPFAFLAVTMGGVGTTQVLVGFTLVLTYLFALANVSLLFSVLFPSSSRAARMTISLVIGYSLICAGLFMLPEWLIFQKDYRPTDPTVVELRSAANWLWSVHPGRHWWILSQGGYISLEIVRTLIVHLGVGLGSFILSLLLFERCCGSEAAYASKDGRSKSRWRWFGRPKRTLMRAIAWKDFHFAMGGRRSIVGRCLGYAAVVGVVAYFANKAKMDDMTAEFAWGFGILMLHAELAVMALLMWGPEAWGQHIGSLVATPMSLLRMSKEKLRAIFFAIIPSIGLLMLAMFVGGSQFIRTELIEPYTNSYPGTGGFPPNIVNIIMLFAWTVQLFLLLSLIVNLSLRLKWTALPAALGLFALFQMVTEISFQPLSSINRPLPGYALTPIVGAFTALAFVYFINRNTHTLLLRRAAEG